MSTRSSFNASLIEGAKVTAPLLPAAASIGLVTGVVATIVVGMGVLWTVTYLFG